MRSRIIVMALATLTVVGLVAAPAAQAKAGDVIERGSCSSGSDWKLKLSEEGGRIEAEFEVDQNVSGDRWRVRIRHDGDLAFRGTRTTGGGSGSFDVRIVEPNGSGTDHFVGRARNVSTGEVCSGSASF